MDGLELLQALRDRDLPVILHSGFQDVEAAVRGVQLGAVDFEVGVIAGTRTMNPWMAAMLPNPDDGKVSVARTQVDGMTDFLIVDSNHHHIMEDELVIRNTLLFLRTGAFDDHDKSSQVSAAH